MNTWKNKLVAGFLAVVLALSLGLGALVYHYGYTYEKTTSVYMKSLNWVLPHSVKYRSILLDEQDSGLYLGYYEDQVDFIDTAGTVVDTLNRTDMADDYADAFTDTQTQLGWTTYKGREMHSIWRIDDDEYAVGFLTRTDELDAVDYMVFDAEMNPLFGERMFDNIQRESDGMRYFVSSERNFDGTPAVQECGFMNAEGKTVFTFDHEPRSVNDFSEGLSIVYDDKLYGYDKRGKVVFALDYTSDEISPSQRDVAEEYDVSSPYYTHFAGGLAPVTLDGDKFGYINKSGEFIIEPLFKEARIVMEQTAAVCLIQSDVPSTLVNSRWGILDLKGVQ